MNNVVKKNLKIIFNFFPIILSIFLIKANINKNKIIKISIILSFFIHINFKFKMQ